MNNNRTQQGSIFFIRPVPAILLVIFLFLAGILGYQSMIKESAPDLAIPQALVITQWPGASPEMVEKEITNRLEKEIKSLPGLKRYRSGSRPSGSVIAVEFTADSNLQEAIQLLRTRVADAGVDLPKEAKQPKIEQVSITDTPVISFMLTGDVDHKLMGRTARSLRHRLERLRGCRKVKLTGMRKEIVSVQLLPDRLRALGISPVLVRNRLDTANRDMPWGRFENKDFTTTLKLQGTFASLEDIRKLPIVRLQQGRLVRLGEIAVINREIEREEVRTEFSWQGGTFYQGISIDLFKRSGFDSIALIQAAKDEMQKAQKEGLLPEAMHYRVASDQSIFIRDNLLSVFNNGWQAMLVVFVILFFLLSWREAVIAGLSIPLTFAGAIGVLYLLGQTLNQLVIIGMVLALGLLVDVFILVMEGMHDAIFVERKTFAEAARQTVRTYGMPAFAGLLTTLLALAPMFAIGGLDGKFIRVIPTSTMVCLILSFCIAFLVDIPLSRYLLAGAGEQGPKHIDRITEGLSAGLARWLLSSVVASRSRAWLWAGTAGLLFALSLVAISLLPNQLYPKEDGRNLGITIELPPDTLLEEAMETARLTGEMLRKQPYFQAVTKIIGAKSPFAIPDIGEMLEVNRGPWLVGFSCLFKPKDDRKLSAYQYLPRLRQQLKDILNQVPGARLSMVPETGGSSAADPIQIIISGDDLAMLQKISTDTRRLLAMIPGVTDIRDNMGRNRTDLRLRPRRELLDLNEIDEEELAMQVRIAMSDDKVSVMRQQGTADDLDIRLGMRWPSRKGLAGGPREWEEMVLFSIITPDGRAIPAPSLLTPFIDQQPQLIPHSGGQRSITVKARCDDSTTAGEVFARLRPILAEASLSWPAGYRFRFGGEAEASAETYSSAGRVLILAIFLIFCVLSLLFNSFRLPLVVILTVPLALTGTFGGFFLCGIPFSFPAMIGIISLAGIVVNDAIVMVETANSHYKQGMSAHQAAARGAADRLRPIISTTLTTTIGLLPLALGNPIWMPLCAAIIFGLSWATIMQLIIVPGVFMLLVQAGPVNSDGNQRQKSCHAGY